MHITLALLSFLLFLFVFRIYTWAVFIAVAKQIRFSYKQTKRD